MKQWNKKSTTQLQSLSTKTNKAKFEYSSIESVVKLKKVECEMFSQES